MTYKDREGNELAQSEAVATNVPDGTVYSTLESLRFFSFRLRLNKKGFSLYSHYEIILVDIPMNGAGSAEVVISCLMYDKTETVTVNGSVIANPIKTLKAMNSAPQESVKTNVPDEAYTIIQLFIKSSEVVEKKH